MNGNVNKKPTEKRTAHHNLPHMILAIFLAIAVWFIVSMTQYPSVQKTITHIPLSVNINDTAAAANGLSVISCDVEEVTVELLGSRTQVGNLTSENIEAYIDADSVSTTGTKNLSIRIKGGSGVNFEVQSITPETANVVFDKYDTREFDVKPKIPNVSFTDGKAIDPDEFTCDPAVVRINGPSSTLDKIAKCNAVSLKEMELDSSYVLQADELQLYTEDGALIDQSSLKFSSMNFNINIPVRTQKTVGLTVAIANAPSGFDKSSIGFKLSTDNITLACNNTQTEIPDTLEIGKIPLNDLDLGYSKVFKLSNILENTEYINLSDTETVTVTLDDSELSKIDLNLDPDKITISNAPDTDYDYNVLTQKLSVSVVGPADVLSEITADDIIADVNLLNAEIASNQFNYYANFSCSKYDNVWVITNTRISLERTKKESEATTASSDE